MIKKTTSENQQILENFHVILQEPSEEDATLYWKYNIPIIKSKEKKCLLIFKKQTICLVDHDIETVPKIIHLICDDINGLISNNGDKTQTVVIFRLFNEVLKEEGKIDLFYESNEVEWDIGCLRTLKFRLKIEDETEFVSGTLQNEINLDFSLIHE